MIALGALIAMVVLIALVALISLVALKYLVALVALMALVAQVVRVAPVASTDSDLLAVLFYSSCTSSNPSNSIVPSSVSLFLRKSPDEF